MSGGSYDYAFHHIDDFIGAMRADTPERVAFRAHLELVSAAMKAIEWVDSYDYVENAEVEPINECLRNSKNP